MMINLKQYYRQAIVRNKTNLDEMVHAVWAIWKHKVNMTKNDFIKKKKYFIIGFLERRTTSRMVFNNVL